MGKYTYCDEFGSNLAKLINELLPDIGLKDFEVDMSQNFNTLNTYTMYFSKPFTIDFIDRDNMKSVVDNIIVPILDNIKNSPVAKAKYQELEDKLNKAESRIKELEPFETYYNLAMKMQHGENKS